MLEQNLNPDALEAAKNAFDHAMGLDTDDYFQPWEEEAPSKYRDIGVEPAVSAYLSALPAQPELQENSKPNQNLELQPDTVNSVEELEALPESSYIVDKEGEGGHVSNGRIWLHRSGPWPFKLFAEHFCPATVIYKPAVNDA